MRKNLPSPFVDMRPLFGHAEAVEPELLGHAVDFHAGQADLRGLIRAVDRQRLGLPALETFAGGCFQSGIGDESAELYGGLRLAFSCRERACTDNFKERAFFVLCITRELHLDANVGRCGPQFC